MVSTGINSMSSTQASSTPSIQALFIGPTPKQPRWGFLPGSDRL